MFGKTQARTFIIVSVFWIISSTDVLGLAGLLLSVAHCLLYLDDRNPCKEHTLVQVLMADVRTNAQSPPHTHLLPPSKPQKRGMCVAAAGWLEWQAKTVFPVVTAMDGFYSTRSPCITWKMYQNYSRETACNQLEFRCNEEDVNIHLWLLSGYYLFPSFSDEW